MIWMTMVWLFWQQMNIVFEFQVNGGPHRDCTGDVSLLHLFHLMHWVLGWNSIFSLIEIMVIYYGGGIIILKA